MVAVVHIAESPLHDATSSGTTAAAQDTLLVVVTGATGLHRGESSSVHRSLMHGGAQFNIRVSRLDPLLHHGFQVFSSTIQVLSLVFRDRLTGDDCSLWNLLHHHDHGTPRH